MGEGEGRFYLKVVVGIVVGSILIALCGSSFETTLARFGIPGLIPWFIGLAALGLGVLAAWASVISFLDRLALTRYRANPEDRFQDGQVLALSGVLETSGEPLLSPFGGIPCAACRYTINGQRRTTSSSGSGTRSQLCLIGLRLAAAELAAGERRFPLLAVPDVDTDFRESQRGQGWGERAADMIHAVRESASPMAEPEARGRSSDAARHAEPPLDLDLFVSAGAQASSSLNVSEDAVPVGRTVTVLGTFTTLEGGLDGRRLGGMKVFAGTIDERLAALTGELRKGIKVGLPSGLLGAVLMTLAFWWPG